MNAALLIIDVQIGLVGLMPGELKDHVLPNITALLTKARSSGSNDGEPIISKEASDSFFETRLAEELQKGGIKRLIIVGGMTEYCVDTTCRRAVTLGYDVTLVADAHLTRDTPVLTASQIIAHHNLVLDGFAAGTHSIEVKPTAHIFL